MYDRKIQGAVSSLSTFTRADCYDTHSTGYSWGRAVKTEEHTKKKEPIGKARNAAVQCLILRTFGKDIERER